MGLSLSAQVKKQLNIVDVMRESGLQLKQEGTDSYSCKCPFHIEKTPSFKVSEFYQTYHCFGCGASGDVIQFFAQQNALDYKASTLILAEKLGIKIDKKQHDNFSQQKRLLELAKSLDKFYKKEFNELNPSHPAKKQITNRNLKIAEDYFGYAPYNGQVIIDYITAKGYTIDDMKALGYINEKGNIQLTNRLIFTIKNYMGSVVGFSGRDLTNSENFKYVNSKSSEIFDKSQALYNIDQAKYTAKKTNMLFLVEGQFDVIAMVQKGYSNTVAISGTAFTTKHLNIINRMITDTGKIVLCLDGDKAGQKAALKIFKEQPSIQSRLYLIILPDNKDPCEYLQEHDHLPQPIKLLDFLFNSLRRKYPPNILENRQKFIEQLQENITQYIADNSLKEIYLKTACSMVGISYHELKQKSFNFIEYNKTNTAQEDSSIKLSQEDLLYIKSLAIYIKHLMILPLINYNDYPKRYANFINEVINIITSTKHDDTIKIIPELFQNKKLISLIIQVDVNKLDDAQLAQDYYLNILKLAQQETKKDSINRKKIDIVNSVQDMDSKQFLEYLHINEHQGGLKI